MSDSEDDYGGYDVGGGHSSPEYYVGGGHFSPEHYIDGGQSSPERYVEYTSEEDPDEADDPAFPPGKLVKPNFGSYETQNTTKFHLKDFEDGKGYSARFSEAYKGEDFVEKHTGNPGFKEEVRFESRYKVDDKVEGSTTEYKKQVKTSKKVTINVDKSSSFYSGSGSNSAMSSSFKHLNIK